ncbi:hypothetical protein DRE_05084 [Drechslerella stenobrocha 248]|uniref:Uncharacterized protein n=1 Tax=Drechslerella stenobrocha 248 TaxID=1043628 RepID=W7HZU6_9PEZI|nr:hypothetical protein DRE_05084 [Drechslerella stenobrocha 248]
MAAALQPSRLDIIRAYRHLLRAGLQAVQYSSPARYCIRSKLRHAFSLESPPSMNASGSPACQLPTVFPKAFSQARIDNTIRFLDTAARRLGMEHTIVKHLCHVEYRRNPHMFPRNINGLKPNDWEPLNVLFDEYDDTLRMLNETMQVELR